MKKKSYVKKNTSQEDINEFVKYVSDNIPKEINKGVMIPPKKSLRYSFRFNNYRRAIKFPIYKEITYDNLQRKYKGNPKWNFCNQNKTISIKFKKQITILISKNTITGIWSQNIIKGRKEVFVVETENAEQMSEWLDKKKNDINNEIDNALKELVKHLKIPLKIFNPIIVRKEIEIKGDDFIDKLPPDIILHDTVGKKVYSRGFEFNDESYVKNTIKNKALKDISPIIQEQLLLIDKKIDLLDKRQETLSGAMDYYDKNVVKHFKVLNKMSKVLDRINNKLSQEKLSKWL